VFQLIVAAHYQRSSCKCWHCCCCCCCYCHTPQCNL